MKDIKTKLIVKDTTENLVHLLPDTTAEQVIYNNTDLATFLDEGLSTVIQNQITESLGDANALTFKGTIGSSGTVSNLPADHTAQKELLPRRLILD